jgi:1,4-alpha-glucan branching enzyme
MKRRRKMSTPAEKPQTISITFECKADRASAVFLAGSFNDWNESVTPMKRAESGVWSANLDLLPGRYEYKFVIDGQWCCSPELLTDANCASCVPNTFGTMNFAAEVGREET